jgi:hypothetical protein
MPLLLFEGRGRALNEVSGHSGGPFRPPRRLVYLGASPRRLYKPGPSTSPSGGQVNPLLLTREPRVSGLTDNATARSKLRTPTTCLSLRSCRRR